MNLDKKQDTEEYVIVDHSREIRCPTENCNRLLFKGDPPETGMEIKCPRCKRLIRFRQI